MIWARAFESKLCKLKDDQMYALFVTYFWTVIKTSTDTEAYAS